MRRAPPPDWLQRIFDEDDRQRRDYESFQARLQTKTHQRGELVHKVYDPEERAQPQHVVDLTPEAAQRWNDWADKRIATAIERFKNVEIVPLARDAGQIIGRAEKEIQALRAELEKLQIEVNTLRIDADVERAAKIIDLPNPLSRHRDAA